MDTIPEPQPLAIAVRAYAAQKKKEPSSKNYAYEEDIGASDDWVLVFDTETTADHAYTLRVGVYHLYKRDRLIEKGIFYNPDQITDDDELSTLKSFCVSNDFEISELDEFIEDTLFKRAYDVGATIVGFNLPFDLSRLAFKHVNARKRMYGGFSFKLTNNEFRPQILIKYLNRHASIIKFRKVGSAISPSREARGEKQSSSSGYFVDLGTLAWALTDRGFSLESLAEHLETNNRKQETQEHGAKLTAKYLEYASMDVEVTWQCFVKLRERYNQHGLSTPIEKVLSGATLGKAYLQQMGILPWRKAQPKFPQKTTGIIMSSYFGGRSEVRIRQSIRQIAYCDFLSMYPTVCTLMGLWKWVIATGIDATDNAKTKQEAQAFIDDVTLTDLQNPDTWKKLCTLVQVKPEADLFPVRAKYDTLEEDIYDLNSNAQYNIGVNYLSSDSPLWFTLADCIVSKILTGKSPTVLRAIKLCPNYPQDDLAPIHILSKNDYAVDPYENDFYKQIIELRNKTKEAKQKATGEARKKLDIEQHALKILANATSYGIFVQLNVNEVAEEKITTCHNYAEDSYTHLTQNIEEPGPYYHPAIGTFITGAARLMLGLAEKLASLEGLGWVFCDTDSMAFAKADDMTSDVFNSKVTSVREKFSSLNPYAGNDDVFKLEDANYRLDENLQVTTILEPIYCLAVSAKRYVMFNYDSAGQPIIRKGSAHGLGHLKAPYEERRDRPEFPDPIFPKDELVSETGITLWQHDLWYQIICNHLSGQHYHNPATHSVFNQPSVRRYAATTPSLLSWYDFFNEGKPYSEQVKPFNFLLAYKTKLNPTPRILLDEKVETSGSRNPIHYPSAVAPFDKDLHRAVTKCFDRKTGNPVSPEELETYQRSLSQYHLHPENKFLDGGYSDRGLTRRRHIFAFEIRSIGKEANRLEEQEELEPREDYQIEYGTSPDDYARFAGKLKELIKRHDLRAVALMAGISERQLSSIVKGKAFPQTNTHKNLMIAFSYIEKEAAAKERQNSEMLSWLNEAFACLSVEEQKLFAKQVGSTPSNVRQMLKRERNLSPKVMAAYSAHRRAE